MKKKIEVTEVLTFRHEIEVEIEDEKEEEFEEFADNVAEEIEERGERNSMEDVVNMFTKEYGKDKVTFVEDGSPEREYEVF